MILAWIKKNISFINIQRYHKNVLSEGKWKGINVYLERQLISRIREFL